MTKSETPKVVPSSGVAVKKSDLSSPASSRIPTTLPRRDALFNQFNAMSLTQLKAELHARSLQSTGTRSDLVDLLVAYELNVCMCV